MYPEAQSRSQCRQLLLAWWGQLPLSSELVSWQLSSWVQVGVVLVVQALFVLEALAQALFGALFGALLGALVQAMVQVLIPFFLLAYDFIT